MARNVLTGMFSSGAWTMGHCTGGRCFLLYQRGASDEHDAVAREVGRNGGVLLKNEKTFFLCTRSKGGARRFRMALTLLNPGRHGMQATTIA